MNQTLSYYSKKELQIVVIADMCFPDAEDSESEKSEMSPEILVLEMLERLHSKSGDIGDGG